MVFQNQSSKNKGDEAASQSSPEGSPPPSSTKELQLLSLTSTRQPGAKCRLYRVTPSTKVTFVARNYRLVFVLDLSPTIASIVSPHSVNYLVLSVEVLYTTNDQITLFYD